MKEHYVSYEQSQALKRLGFAEGTTHYYVKFREDGELKFWYTSEPDNHNARESHNEVCSAPCIYQAQAWVREVKGIDIELRVWLVGNKREYRPYVMPHKCKDYIAYPPEKSYELALSAGIAAALELLTNKDDRK